MTRHLAFVLLVPLAVSVAWAKPAASPALSRVGWLCVGARDRYVVQDCGDRFHAAGLDGQPPPPCPKAPRKVQTFRVGDGPWFEAPPKGHRCAPVPVGQKTWFWRNGRRAWKQAVPAACRSHAMDLNGPNPYAATFFLCTKRDRRHDQLVPAVRSKAK